jgi:hypothetical protein
MWSVDSVSMLAPACEVATRGGVGRNATLEVEGKGPRFLVFVIMVFEYDGTVSPESLLRERR